MKQILLTIQSHKITMCILNAALSLFELLPGKALVRTIMQLSQNADPLSRTRILFHIYKFYFPQLEKFDPNFRPIDKKQYSQPEQKKIIEIIDFLIKQPSIKKSTYLKLCIFDMQCLAGINQQTYEDVFRDWLEPLSVAKDSNAENEKIYTHIAKAEKNLDIEKAHQALKRIDELMKQAGIDYFLVSGTLLGAIREGNFLAHDCDIDLGCFYSEKIFTDIIGAFSGQTDFQLVTIDEPYLLRLRYLKTLDIDIFIHFEDGDVMWHGSSYHRWNNRKFALKSIEFLDNEYQIPEDYDVYLTENYGDWRTPKKDFDCFFDTPNVEQQSTHEAKIFLMKQIWYSHKKNDVDRLSEFKKRLEKIL